MGIRLGILLTLAVASRAHSTPPVPADQQLLQLVCLHVLPLMEQSVSELDIPKPVAAALKKAGWKTLGQLIKIPIEVVQARTQLTMDEMWTLIVALQKKKIFFNQPLRFVSIAILRDLPREEILKLPVAELNLSTRAFNGLAKHNLLGIRELVEKSPDDLMKLQNFGVGCLVEVTETLDAIGLSLDGKPGPDLKDKIRVHKDLQQKRARPLAALGLSPKEAIACHMRGMFSVDELLRMDPATVIQILGWDRFIELVERAEREKFQPHYWKHRLPRVRARIVYEQLRAHPESHRLAQPISIMPLRLTAAGAIQRLRVRTIGDLAHYRENELVEQGVTVPTVRELRDLLALIDLKFGTGIRISRPEPFDVTTD